MINVVKLILVCQTKDIEIPQLIPLYWVCYMLIFVILIFMIKIIYRFSFLDELEYTSKSKNFYKDLWFW